MTTDTGTSLTSAVSAVGAVSAAFRGADADELRSNAQRMTQAAHVVDEVKAACQAIVAASFFLGPFGASFIAYLEHTVIPWLTKVSQALQLLSKVLSFHAGAQDDAQSPASLPSYSSPTDGTTSPVSSGSTAGDGTAWSGAPGAGSVTAPGIGSGMGSGVGSSLGLGSGGATATSSPAASSSTPYGIPAGSAVGMLEIPVAVAPDGQIVPLLTTGDAHPSSYDSTNSTIGAYDNPSMASPALSGATQTTVPTPTSFPSTPTALAVAHHLPASSHENGHDLSGTGGGYGGGSGAAPLGGGSGSSVPIGTEDLASYSPSTPTLGHDLGNSAGKLAAGLVDTAGQPAELTAAPGGTGASHDGLFAGLGQATGIGAGGAALARAVIVEARRATAAAPLPGLPADAQSDAAPQWQIFDGTLG